MKPHKEVSIEHLNGKEVYTGIVPSGELAYIHETESNYQYCPIEHYSQKFTLEEVN